MLKRARDAGIEMLTGEYLPTLKNAMVKDLYARMGFTANNGKWTLNLRQHKDFKVFICPK
jgi:predicted enzyme involved in methoxymalonyl-ACP biosynthesis